MFKMQDGKLTLISMRLQKAIFNIYHWDNWKNVDTPELDYALSELKQLQELHYSSNLRGTIMGLKKHVNYFVKNKELFFSPTMKEACLRNEIPPMPEPEKFKTSSEYDLALSKIQLYYDDLNFIYLRERRAWLQDLEKLIQSLDLYNEFKSH